MVVSVGGHGSSTLTSGPMKPLSRRRFGEPEPAFVTWLVVVFPRIAAATSADDAHGLAARNAAATPATCGEAIDVPLMVVVPPVSQSDVMLAPGANRSTQEPKFENDDRASDTGVDGSAGLTYVPVDATVDAAGARAGLESATRSRCCSRRRPRR